MKLTRRPLARWASGLVLASASWGCQAALVLTGNAEVDLNGPGVVVLSDGAAPDVLLPPGFNTVSGWDVKDLRLSFSGNSLVLAINTYGIAGDADGDGDPSGTSTPLQTRLGRDLPDFTGSESFAVCFDFDQDGICDVVAGISGLSARFTVNRYAGSPGLPLSEAFGSELTTYGASFFGIPTAAAPDLEFTIADFRALSQDFLSSGSDTASTFSVRAFLGSFEDDGIGEDSVGSFIVDLPARANAVPAPPAMLLTVTALLALYRARRSRRG